MGVVFGGQNVPEGIIEPNAEGTEHYGREHVEPGEAGALSILEEELKRRG